MPIQNNSTNSAISTCQVLIPVALVSVVLFLSLTFQTVQIMRDREALKTFIAQQDKPVEDSRKIQSQLTALALGTKKLAEGGDKNATAIINRMQQLGITVGGEPAATGTPMPAAPAQP